MFYGKLFLALSLAGYSEAFFRISCPGRLVRERLDPIVSPGKIASHVHTISGGSAFGPSMTDNGARAAKCSSCQIKVMLLSLTLDSNTHTLTRKTCPITGRLNSTST